MPSNWHARGVLLGAVFLAGIALCPAPKSCAEQTCPSPLCLESLSRMGWGDLDQLYRQLGPGPVPCGYFRGRAIYCDDRALSGTRSAVTRLIWHGKHFDGDECTLLNQWTGFKAVKARVYPGPSWLDGQPSTIMDYQGTSRVWNDVRDEIREAGPGLYLGAMYRRRCPEPRFQMFFALEADCKH